MSIGFSLIMIAAGAILSFALDFAPNPHFDWVTAGVVLMAVGALGLLISLGQSGVFSSRRRSAYGARRNTVYADPASRRRSPGDVDPTRRLPPDRY